MKLLSTRLIAAAAIMAVIAAPAFAGEETSPKNPTDSEIMEKNVRLDVWLIPLEEDDEETFVILASPKFSTGIEFANDDIEISFSISGELKVLESGNFFIRYKAFTSFESPEGDGSFSTSSSAILEPGKELSVSHIGEKTLVLLASYKLREDPDK